MTTCQLLRVFTWRHQNWNQQTIDSSEFLLSWGITAPRNLYLQKFLVPNDSSFCDRRRLNFQLHDAAFRWRPGTRLFRLRVVPHFSSGIVERAFSRVWWFSRALVFRSLYYPWGKMGTTRSLSALMWVKNVTDFLRFCYLNSLCLRINITLIFMSSSSDEFSHK